MLTSPAKWRSLTTLLLLMPGTPMLFQGQEFAASSPFLYFADFDADLAAAVKKGRAEFLSQFPSIVDYARRHGLDDPDDERAFARCKLDFAERETNEGIYALHRDCCGCGGDPAFKSQRPEELTCCSDRGAFVFGSSPKR